MRVLLQRVSHALVRVADEIVGSIDAGLVIFLGINQEDSKQVAEKLAEQAVQLRIFEDAGGKTNLSAGDVQAQLLVISQFTLYADCRRGRRPGFSYAARPETAEPLYEYFMERLKKLGFSVASGCFGAHMVVEIHNDGPFTIFLDSDDRV